MLFQKALWFSRGFGVGAAVVQAGLSTRLLVGQCRDLTVVLSLQWDQPWSFRHRTGRRAPADAVPGVPGGVQGVVGEEQSRQPSRRTWPP